MVTSLRRMWRLRTKEDVLAMKRTFAGGSVTIRRGICFCCATRFPRSENGRGKIVSAPPPTNVTAQIQNALTRRAFLKQSSTGLGALALASLLKPEVFAMEPGTGAGVPGALQHLHFAPKAKRIIFLFMSGAPSHRDLFDPKPKLTEMTGKNLPDSVCKGQRITTMTSGQKNLLCGGSPLRSPIMARPRGHLRVAAAPDPSRG